ARTCGSESASPAQIFCRIGAPSCMLLGHWVGEVVPVSPGDSMPRSTLSVPSRLCLVALALAHAASVHAAARTAPATPLHFVPNPGRFSAPTKDSARREAGEAVVTAAHCPHRGCCDEPRPAEAQCEGRRPLGAALGGACTGSAGRRATAQPVIVVGFRRG